MKELTTMDSTKIEKVRKYIYDDYGIDIVKTWYSLKDLSHRVMTGNVMTTIFKVIQIIILLCVSGIVCVSTLLVCISHPISSMIVVSVLLIGMLYMYYYFFIK